MPVIRRTIAAASENAVQGLRFSNMDRASLISVYASTPTEGEKISVGVNDLNVLESGVVNVESASTVVDVQRDQVLFREPVGAGQLVVAVPAVAADFTFMVVIEPL